MNHKTLQSVFRSIDEKGSGKVKPAAVIDCLAKAGIAANDPRIAPMLARLDLGTIRQLREGGRCGRPWGRRGRRAGAWDEEGSRLHRRRHAALL